METNKDSIEATVIVNADPFDICEQESIETDEFYFKLYDAYSGILYEED